jgi:trehalose-6-phosphate synthase
VQTYSTPTLIWRAESAAFPSPLVIVSNRAPIEYYEDESGGLRRRRTGGGVATALSSIVNALPVTWIASAASDIDRMIAEEGRPLMLGEGNTLRLVAAPKPAYDLFYSTF